MRGPSPRQLIPVAAPVAIGATITLVVRGGLEALLFYTLVGLVVTRLVIWMSHLLRRDTTALWVLLGLTFLWGAAALVDSSDSLSVLGLILYDLGGLVLGLVTAALCVIVALRGVRECESWRRLVPAPLVVQLALLTLIHGGVSLGWSFQARFVASAPALEAAASAVRAHETVRPGRIGLFRVREIDTAGDAVRFIITASTFDDTGLVHSPGKEPPVVDEDSYEHLQGPWWLWRRSW